MQLAQDKLDVRLESDVADILVEAFDELRRGMVEGSAIDSPSTVLSTAEAIGVAYSAALDSHYFGESNLLPRHLCRYIVGTVIKDDTDDIRRFKEYLRVVESKRKHSSAWQDFLKGYRY